MGEGASALSSDEEGLFSSTEVEFRSAHRLAGYLDGVGEDACALSSDEEELLQRARVHTCRSAIAIKPVVKLVVKRCSARVCTPAAAP